MKLKAFEEICDAVILVDKLPDHSNLKQMIAGCVEAFGLCSNGTVVALNDFGKVVCPKAEPTDEINKTAGKVLVVEDDFASQQVILGMLEETNLQAETADNGIEAVNKVTSGSYDLIFMDIQMPNMNGYEATKIIRAKGYTLPIIALTAYAMKGDEEKCLNAGCDAYLSKPVDAEKLFETLGKFLLFESDFMLDEINAARREIDELNRQFCSTNKATVNSINSGE